MVREAEEAEDMADSKGSNPRVSLVFVMVVQILLGCCVMIFRATQQGQTDNVCVMKQQ